MRYISIFLLILFYTLGTNVLASEIMTQTNIRVSQQHETNPLLLRTDEKESIDGLIYNLNFVLNRRLKSEHSYIKTEFKHAEYDSEASLDYDNQYVSASHQSGFKNGSWLVNANYADESSRITEIEDTGTLDLRVPKLTKSITSSLNYSLSQTNAVEISPFFSEVSYGNDSLNRLIDYDYQLARITFYKTLSEKRTVFINTEISDYETKEFDSQSVSKAWKIGFVEKINSNSELDFSFGNRETRFSRTVDNVSFKENSNTETYTINFKNKFRLGSLSLNYSSDLSPSGAGVVLERNELSISYSNRINRNLSLVLSYRQLENEELQDNEDDINRKLETSILSLNWKFDRNWSLTGYFRKNDQSIEGLDSESDLLALSIKFDLNNRI